ncbi:MAG: SDR family NAD(P)-dependent oxidoreductase, partial [Gammaproteobacteria bacterium]|nr:SDR family NAD(P)-dependent oxidoreductase [Gammaproteobacteria bacterium]
MKTILVTGANRGIGLALVKHFRSRGDSVVAVCRHGSDELAATGARVEPGIDVTDDAALAALDARLGELRLDELWLNAGVLERDTLDKLDENSFEAIRRQFEVNAMGPLRVAHALHHRLGKGSKIAIITSRMGSIQDNGSG